MGRILTTEQKLSSANLLSGPFGSNRALLYKASGTFTVPDGVTSVRVRIWGAGGAGNYNYLGGGTAGGTTSFGSYLSVTGGSQGTPSVKGTGGVSTGGDVNYTGGNGYFISNSGPGGGGSVANIYGNGTNATSSSGANGWFSDTAISNFNSLDIIGNGQGGTAPINLGGGGGSGDTGGYGWDGGFPGGGGGSYQYGGGGGGGFGIKIITGLTAGSTITVTIGAGGTNPYMATGHGKGGLVIVEY